MKSSVLRNLQIRFYSKNGQNKYCDLFPMNMMVVHNRHMKYIINLKQQNYWSLFNKMNNNTLCFREQRYMFNIKPNINFNNYRMFSGNAKKKRIGNKSLEERNITKDVEYIYQNNNSEMFFDSDEKSSYVNNSEMEYEKKKKKKRSKIKLLFYSFNIIFGGYVIYKIYKNDLNLSKAEEDIIKDIINILYSNEEKVSIRNSKFLTCLNDELNRQIAMYFIQLDTDKKSGFLRSDAIQLLLELNIKEEYPLIKNFIKNGVGKNNDEKKLSGCSLQEFAELIENIILTNKSPVIDEQEENKTPTFKNEKEYYMYISQQYLDMVVNFIKTSNLYLYYQMNKKRKNNEVNSFPYDMDNFEKEILNKLMTYNNKYVDKNNLSLDYLLSKEELNNLRKNNNPSKGQEDRELLLIERKKIEEKIKLLQQLQRKRKNLTDIEIQRLIDLKAKLRTVKKAIWKEEIKKYFT
ncbi:conserved Plasmodium protein, unknown function [Plasmodium reichenowi]|uniref:Uncharacterized protein n=1 Tax=Plasmodium reichenowi TaxID=5854 RepID=A0A060RQM9_PLARE|nr:conserved Plasmodium protein, unknown function [Plasmodium reichenowi]SOV77736.1 conserved Plasmodium protein, unknown function [Plasmodium reichenowi]